MPVSSDVLMPGVLTIVSSSRDAHIAHPVDGALLVSLGQDVMHATRGALAAHSTIPLPGLIRIGGRWPDDLRATCTVWEMMDTPFGPRPGGQSVTSLRWEPASLRWTTSPDAPTWPQQDAPAPLPFLATREVHASLFALDPSLTAASIQRLSNVEGTSGELYTFGLRRDRSTFAFVHRAGRWSALPALPSDVVPTRGIVLPSGALLLAACRGFNAFPQELYVLEASEWRAVPLPLEPFALEYLGIADDGGLWMTALADDSDKKRFSVLCHAPG